MAITYRQIREKQVVGDKVVNDLFNNDADLQTQVTSIATTQAGQQASLDALTDADSRLDTLEAQIQGGGALCNALYSWDGAKYAFVSGLRGALPLSFNHGTPIAVTFDSPRASANYRVFLKQHRTTAPAIVDCAVDNQTTAGFEIHMTTAANPYKKIAIEIWES